MQLNQLNSSIKCQSFHLLCLNHYIPNLSEHVQIVLVLLEDSINEQMGAI